MEGATTGVGTVESLLVVETIMEVGQPHERWFITFRLSSQHDELFGSNELEDRLI
jgi:hypothetical protein